MINYIGSNLLTTLDCFGRTFQGCVPPGLYEINDITTACIGDDKMVLNILNKLHVINFLVKPKVST